MQDPGRNDEADELLYCDVVQHGLGLHLPGTNIPKVLPFTSSLLSIPHRSMILLVLFIINIFVH
jgi:hypothetical protein